MQSLDFEKPLMHLEERIRHLRARSEQTERIIAHTQRLQKRLEERRRRLYQNLTPWQRVQLARHPLRPKGSAYIEAMIDDFQMLQGDRLFGEDEALICGMGRLHHHPVMVLAQDKGSSTEERVQRNFGMMHPEGYRKAQRMVRLAERFHMPIIVLIDTPGAFAGLAAEERGQSQAIAENMLLMSEVKVPIIAVIIGEGASGGALGLGVADHVAIMANAYYATIAPEGCARILYKDAAQAEHIASSMGLTAQKLLEDALVDAIIEEPLAAHLNPSKAIAAVEHHLAQVLAQLIRHDTPTLLEKRYERFRRMGQL